MAGSLVADKHDDTDGWNQPWWSAPQAVEHIGSVKVLLGTVSEDKVETTPGYQQNLVSTQELNTLGLGYRFPNG